MTEFEMMHQMVKRLDSHPYSTMKLRHKHNPEWQTLDRLTVSVKDLRLTFEFDRAGALWSYSWNPDAEEVG